VFKNVKVEATKLVETSGVQFKVKNFKVKPERLIIRGE